MTSPPWFRFYSEALNDRKIDRICKTANQPKAVVIGVWTVLLSLASDSPIRGALLLTDDIPFTAGDLQSETGLDEETLEVILTQFQRFEMLSLENGVYYVPNWNKRQFASDHSIERVRKHRARKKATESNGDSGVTDETGSGYGNGDVTLQDSYGNAPEQNRAEQSRAEHVAGATPAPPSGPPESKLDAVFGPKPEREPVEPTPPWDQCASEAWARWGNQSKEFRHQLGRFGGTGRRVQRLGYRLDTEFGLHPNWGNPKAVKAWAAGLSECLQLADHDGGLVVQAARKLRDDGMTIANPYSLHKTIQALAAERRAPPGQSGLDAPSPVPAV